MFRSMTLIDTLSSCGRTLEVAIYQVFCSFDIYDDGELEDAESAILTIIVIIILFQLKPDIPLVEQ